MENNTLEFDWIDAIRSFKRWRKIYALILALALGAAVGLSLWIKPTYKATVTLLPTQSKDSKVNRLEAIASKFGLDSPVPGTNFADFLEPIVDSKTFLLRLAEIKVRDVDGSTKRLWDTFEYPGESPDLDSLVYLSRLRGMVHFLKKASGLIEISVIAPTSDMAAALANESIRIINGFNQEYNYSNARANVAFLTEQLAGAEGQKTRAAANLVNFMENNRGIDPNVSPALYSRFSALKVLPTPL